jgi:predicted AlkP superfamily phosphohydrolase/phosphomutase
MAEWGGHDRHFGFQTQPEAFSDEIERDYGLHPVFGMDARAVRDFAPDDFLARQGGYRTRAEEKLFVDTLLQGVALKSRLTLDLLRRRDWDFFLSVHGESHAVGHQQWHLHDSTHPRFNAEIRDYVGGDPVLQVYQALDESLGRVMDEVGGDALLLVHFSHGIGPHYDCTHLLEEVLTRLDQRERSPAKMRSAAWLKQKAKPVLGPLRRFAYAVGVPEALRGRVGQRLQVAEYAIPEMRARQRFFVGPNNALYAGIRLNLAGREPRGCVQPEEAEAICTALEADLIDLKDADTGEPVVRAVFRSDDHHERRHDDLLPDLMVLWTWDRQTEAVASPKIGTVRAPYQGWRTGDHRPYGLLLMCGEGFESGARLPTIAVEDIGPSIAAYLGVTLDGVDGEPADWPAEAAVA